LGGRTSGASRCGARWAQLVLPATPADMVHVVRVPRGGGQCSPSPQHTPRTHFHTRHIPRWWRT
jgi:hypothetical protein